MVRNGQILQMLYRKNLYARVTAAEKDSLLSITTRFLALVDEITLVSPREIEKSEKGEVIAGMKISSILSRLSFRWWLSLQPWMSLRQAEMQVETCMSDEGKEIKCRSNMANGPSVNGEE